MDRRTVAALAVLGLVLSAGCAQVTVRATVAEGPTVERYAVTVETTATVEELLNESAREAGYDSLLDRARANLSETVGAGTVTATRRQRGENVTLRLVATDVDAAAAEDLSVERTDGRIVYRDRSVVSNGTQPNLGPDVGGVEVNYTVVMPTEVVASNADRVNGTRARYRFGADDPQRSPVRVESRAPTGPLGLPGVGAVGAALAAAVGVVLAGLWGRRRRAGGE